MVPGTGSLEDCEETAWAVTPGALLGAGGIQGRLTRMRVRCRVGLLRLAKGRGRHWGLVGVELLGARGRRGWLTQRAAVQSAGVCARAAMLCVLCSGRQAERS
jgi:hypothetical protein